MLGYVRIDKGELKVREYEIYTGYYCGVCKSIGHRYGQLPRMALSFDAAFLAVLLESLSDQPDAPSQEHCIAHPVGKKKTVIRNAAIDYAADVMLILAWYKLIDDANDEGKVYAKGTMLLLKGIFKKLQRKYPSLCSGIEQHLTELSKLEKEKCASLDMAADCFSKIMEVIFAEGVHTLYPEGRLRTLCIESKFSSSMLFGDENLGPDEAAAKLGYHMGKWIYLIDAVDDIEENIESGAYNPLLYRFGYDKSAETPAQFRKRIEDDLNFNLFHYLAMLSNCLNSLDIKKNKGIIENIVYFGMHSKTNEILGHTAAADTDSSNSNE